MYLWISRTLDFLLQFCEKKVRLILGRLSIQKGPRPLISCLDATKSWFSPQKAHAHAQNGLYFWIQASLIQ